MEREMSNPSRDEMERGERERDCELVGIDGGKYIKSRRAWIGLILVLSSFFLFVKSLQNRVAFFFQTFQFNELSLNFFLRK